MIADLPAGGLPWLRPPGVPRRRPAPLRPADAKSEAGGAWPWSRPQPRGGDGGAAGPRTVTWFELGSTLHVSLRESSGTERLAGAGLLGTGDSQVGEGGVLDADAGEVGHRDVRGSRPTRPVPGRELA
jgi:hypothetical protein